MRVFVCYTTRDGFVDEIKLRWILSALPNACHAFADLLHNDSTYIQERIELEIANCDLFLGLRSPAFFMSPWVQLELQVAKRFQKEIILWDVSQNAMPGNESLHRLAEVNL
ncbi:MAG: toll/interleukin-1 receptor domain-containing protein [Methylocystaceae bacterium]|nr:toll/interleukin-1 receptor domain-containing protein [Methylocystaceae bacterium]